MVIWPKMLTSEKQHRAGALQSPFPIQKGKSGQLETQVKTTP
jgi:hypothetical protein